jgi:hypothetical protein
VLVQIFWLVSPATSDVIFDTVTPGQELDRLAKKELLVLSKVCCYWHSVVINTPMLWSTIVMKTDVWTAPETMLYLVSQSLERGGNHPLTIKVAAFEIGTLCRQALELLAQHSQRWRDVHFVVADESLELLSGARGSLSLLETLQVDLLANGKAVDTFAITPCLAKATFSGPPGSVPSLPWTQLQSFTCTQSHGHETDFRDTYILHVDYRAPLSFS